MSIPYRELIQLNRGHHLVDVACPLCGPVCKTPHNRARKVLRTWEEDGFITYRCARCRATGWAKGESSNVVRFDRAQIEQGKAKQAQQAQYDAAAKRARARWIWSQRQPVKGSIAEIYLRKARGYAGPLPATLGFLPQRGEHAPAMIAAYGIADEQEPGRLSIADNAVRAVHITKLRPDGLAKANVLPHKITLASPIGAPIMLAPANDLGGLAICEGIEDALSVHAVTGLGAWAAGSAPFMPALADAVPPSVDCVSIFVDDDDAGQKNSGALSARLRERGIETVLVQPGKYRRAA